MSAKSKPMPSLSSDEAAEAFVAGADLSDYDLSDFKPMRFEVVEKEAVLNIHIPVALLEAVKAKAAAKGIPYARYVRMVLEADIAG
ncbi:hypothetical protein PIGHUM_01989 [Pigmentiphaga humi]|uniref:CopG antitoxin of type II toxin-antitoxin system n=1 Tax=Pigmentiphaga humi TaxID=2478468 RepID=A0A3P4B0V7_9BURK|nr:CopG family antitoxin [Pigmentiphaga humi]VCU69924.1 hypothetical protein PIGHUM_01989 [Pigmentiphaga humi]